MGNLQGERYPDDLLPRTAGPARQSVQVHPLHHPGDRSFQGKQLTSCKVSVWQRWFDICFITDSLTLIIYESPDEKAKSGHCQASRLMRHRGQGSAPKKMCADALPFFIAQCLGSEAGRETRGQLPEEDKWVEEGGSCSQSLLLGWSSGDRTSHFSA